MKCSGHCEQSFIVTFSLLDELNHHLKNSTLLVVQQPGPVKAAVASSYLVEHQCLGPSNFIKFNLAFSLNLPPLWCEFMKILYPIVSFLLSILSSRVHLDE